MKKKLALLLALLGLFTLSGCGEKTEKPDGDTVVSTGEPTAPEGETLTLRVVDGAGSGTLVLAGEGSGEVYTLPLAELALTVDGKETDAAQLEDGMLATLIYSGDVLETFPAQFALVRAADFTRAPDESGVYDLCGFYLKVLDDLWTKDDGLNNGITMLSVDLSGAPGNLSEGEKSAIAWIFSGAHGVEGLTLTSEELAAQGYLTEESVASKTTIYSWDDGVLFSITARDAEGAFSLPTLRFDAQKWRTPLGAYYFGDCTLVCSEDGAWENYSVGAEAIS